MDLAWLENLIKESVGFLGETSLDADRALSRFAAVVARSSLWLRSWHEDTDSKRVGEALPVVPMALLSPELDKLPQHLKPSHPWWLGFGALTAMARVRFPVREPRVLSFVHLHVTT